MRLNRMLAAAAVVIGSAALALPVAAQDAATVGVVTGTGTDGLFVRPGPSQGSGDPLETLPEGTAVEVACYVYGEEATGYYSTSSLWHEIVGGGFITDTYLYTGTDGPMPGEPACEDGAAVDEAPVDGAQEQVLDRDAAVSWALDNAEALHNPFGAACTWFVSNALWAGALPQSDEWSGSGVHGRRLLPGSRLAWVAPELVDYLVTEFPVEMIELDLGANAVPEAQPGDVIAYDWNGDGEISHLSYVVDIADGSYPEVAEWGVGGWDSLGTTEYTKRGWTWSETRQEWLQVAHPNVQAYLLHFE
jgi:hypothetical protein